MIVVLLDPILLILVDLVADVFVVRGGNVVIISGPEIEQLHSHFGVEVENANLVVLTIVFADDARVKVHSVLEKALVGTCRG